MFQFALIDSSFPHYLCRELLGSNEFGGRQWSELPICFQARCSRDWGCSESTYTRQA